VVIRYPKDRSIKYAKRLVGMPGEVVFLKGGAVWVDGSKQAPPAEIADLQYSSDDEMGGPPQGSEDRPWHLGADEYVVLGDFSQRSSDSRYWGPVLRADI